MKMSNNPTNCGAFTANVWKKYEFFLTVFNLKVTRVKET